MSHWALCIPLSNARESQCAQRKPQINPNAMKILFVHQNFPGQFRHLAPALASRPGHTVRALAINDSPELPGVQVTRYAVKRAVGQNVHPWLRDVESKVLRGEAAFHAATQMKQGGFHPDVIVAHPGWGESLFLKEVWPRARLGVYCEFYYQEHGADVGFDPEFAVESATDGCRLQCKNINNLMHFELADAGLSPTFWQASTFPESLRSRITVAHDGIDTSVVAPDAQVQLSLRSQFGELKLSRNDEVITFVCRNLEPYRGIHQFIRALPKLLAARPNARVLIVGGDGHSYGAAAPEGKTWRQIFMNEVAESIDAKRVHFLGRVPYQIYVKLLQLSTVHVYLTYPFVLSWSLLEAMSAGCCIVASDTAPVREAIVHRQTGRLVDFFSPEKLAQEVIDLCADAQARLQLGAAARAHAQEHYDLKQICLPRQLAWVQALV